MWICDRLHGSLFRSLCVFDSGSLGTQFPLAGQCARRAWRVLITETSCVFSAKLRIGAAALLDHDRHSSKIFFSLFFVFVSGGLRPHGANFKRRLVPMVVMPN